MRRVLLLVVVVLVATSCGSGETTEVVVSAASSLTDVFAALEQTFEAENPDIDIVLNTGGSTTLREQILGGAPVDVFASASVEIMDDVAAAGLVGGLPEIFATNKLVVAVPEANPGGVRGIEDLERSSLLVGLCAPQVPCGALARAVLGGLGVVPSVDTEEPDVRALRTKIEIGELDVGLVYASDVVGATDLASFTIDSSSLVTRYSIAVLADPGDEDAAQAFVDHVLSAQGRTALRFAGFGQP